MSSSRRAGTSCTVQPPPATWPQRGRWWRSATPTAGTRPTGNGAQAGGRCLGSSGALFLPWGLALCLWVFVLEGGHYGKGGQQQALLLAVSCAYDWLCSLSLQAQAQWQRAACGPQQAGEEGRSCSRPRQRGVSIQRSPWGSSCCSVAACTRPAESR